MLIQPIQMIVNNSNLSLSSAKLEADKLGKKKIEDLLAWFEQKTGKHSPTVVCGCGDKPSWFVYAQSRGARLSIIIDRGEYLFLYG